MVRDNTCWSCEGKGKLDCWPCKGTGKFPCACDKGAWICNSCQGDGYYETYSGKSKTCRACGGMGDTDCRYCGGAAFTVCRKCGGNGYLLCRKCRGTGKFPPSR